MFKYLLVRVTPHAAYRNVTRCFKMRVTIVCRHPGVCGGGGGGAGGGGGGGGKQHGRQTGK